MTTSSTCVECGAALPEAAKFCSQCGAPISRRSSLPPAVLQSSVQAPPHLRQDVLATRAALEGERRRVTVLFADLRGSLGVLADTDPEESQALLDAVLATMVESVHRYDGAVNQVMGDGIMALFGAPLASEDHALRAACAALAMQEAVRALRDPSWEARGAQPQIRVGLHSGEVAIRTVRTDLSMDYRAVGSTTHIAARMEQLATAGSVWLTQTTFELGQGLLRTNPLGPMQVKGVAAPIEVHELTGISVRTRFQANALRGLSPLAGRQEMLAQLEAALATAVAGRSQARVLRGEPGVGKSRLCYELLQRAGSAHVLEAASLSYLSGRPHALLASMARSLFAIDDEDEPTQVRAKIEQYLRERDGQPNRNLAPALELLEIPAADSSWARLDPAKKRRRIEGLMRELLSHWCAQGPSVVLCEDLHWCDPDSLAFVASLVETPPGSRTLLLLTHRPDFSPPWRTCDHLQSLEVTTLNITAADSLLLNLLGANEQLVPLRKWLIARTDGNPFFIEESVRTLVENGLLENRTRALGTERLGSDVPASIEGLLGARVDRLPESAREVLQAAAVLGDQGSVETLRAITDLDAEQFATRLELLTRAELLYVLVTVTTQETRSQPLARTIRFKHALIQEVVYKRLVRPHKRALHLRVVEVIEQQYPTRLGEYVEALAEHAFRAELWLKCAEYQKAACVRAAGRGASALAIAHLDRGLAALGHLPASPEHARAAIDLRLTALAPLLPIGAHERVIELLREAEQYAMELQDSGRLARIACQLSAELWLTARYDQARRSAEQALTLARQLEGDQFALEVAARYNLAMVQHAQADYEAARRCLLELQATFSGAAALRRLGWAGYPSVMIRTFVISTAVMTGSFADAARAFQEGHAIAEQFVHAFSRTMILEQYGMCLMVQGEYHEAERWLRMAFEVCKQEEVHTMYMPIASHLGLALLSLNQVDEACSLIASAAQVEEDRAGHYAVDYLRIAASEAQRRSGQLDLARETAERAVRETAACGERGFHVRALVQLGRVLGDRSQDRRRALDVYSEALALARQLDTAPWCALALQGKAGVHSAEGQLAAAAEAFDAALEIWRRVEAPARVAQVTELRRTLAAAG
ncbi:MAG TPA: adenylate/guanylate cyclase domain-containing protein [Polyangiales bacterium]|nr:adenylate/guanylate cyclase domain-containing protein [Polyangiales bacterium]